MKPEILILMAGLLGCTAMGKEGTAAFPDLLPPRLESWTEREGSLEFYFNEDLSSVLWQMESLPGEPRPGEWQGPYARIPLGAEAVPGTAVRILLEVRDLGGNSNVFLQTCHLSNPRLPGLRIMEAQINGSRTSPDRVELLVLEEGNLAGAEIRDGIPGESCQSLVFPSLEVACGDRILVHFKTFVPLPEGSESRSKNQISAPGSSDNAWDLWVPEGTGLVGTTGTLLVFEKPGGACLDALVYSNRVSNPEDRYGGFGSRKIQEAMAWCTSRGVWTGTGPSLMPEDCVPSGSTTVTRTLCRSEGRDTDGASDWYTAAKASLGEKNPGVAYVPRRR